MVTQTTLSVDDAAEITAAVRARFPMVREPKQQDICYATQNRQDAVKLMSPQVDLVIVVGSPTSSNSNRLRELAQRMDTTSYMVDNADELRPEWFGRHCPRGPDGRRLGARGAGPASDRTHQGAGAVSVRKLSGIEETIKFPLPKGLRIDDCRIGECGRGRMSRSADQ